MTQTNLTSVNTLINAIPFVGSNGILAGQAGNIPAPAIADNIKFLKGDGTWNTPVVLTTTGTSGASTYNTSTGALNIPSYAGSAATPVTQIFISSGTYTPTVGMRYVTVKAVGGGGSGSGSNGSAAGTGSVGVAGSGAGTVEVLLTAAQIGVSQAVTIGAGGAAGGAAGAGNVGGNTTLGTLFNANGGNGGGLVSTAANQTVPGIAGGSFSITTGLELGSTLGDDSLPSYNFGNGTVHILKSGKSGSSRFGSGVERQNMPIVAGVLSVIGAQGTGFGTGSTGGQSYGGGAAQGSAAGLGGKMIIQEWF